MRLFTILSTAVQTLTFYFYSQTVFDLLTAKMTEKLILASFILATPLDAVYLIIHSGYPTGRSLPHYSFWLPHWTQFTSLFILATPLDAVYLIIHSGYPTGCSLPHYSFWLPHWTQFTSLFILATPLDAVYLIIHSGYPTGRSLPHYSFWLPHWTQFTSLFILATPLDAVYLIIHSGYPTGCSLPHYYTGFATIYMAPLHKCPMFRTTYLPMSGEMARCVQPSMCTSSRSCVLLSESQVRPPSALNDTASKPDTSIRSSSRS